MLTFKCFFRIIKANFTTLCMYTGIFIGLTLLIGVFFGGGLIRFQRVSTNIGIVNRDDHPISQGLLDYLDSLHTLIPLEDDMTVLEDAVFFMQVRYVLIIDENFGADFGADFGSDFASDRSNNNGLMHVAAPHNLELNIYIDRQIDTFLQTVNAYLAVGFDYNEAVRLAQQDQLQLVPLHTPEEGRTISMYFGSLVYLFKSLIVMTLGFVLMVFRERDIASRLQVSPTTPKYRTAWLSIACVCTAFGMWVLVMIPAYFLHHESLFSVRGGLHMLNSLALVIVCVCIGVLLTRIVKNPESLIRFTTLIAFISGFGSGMLAPVELLDDTVRAIARFTPAYWYGHSNRILIADVLGQEVYMADFWLGIGIQLCFAAALFTLALVIGREREALK